MQIYTSYWNRVLHNNTNGYLIVQVSNTKPGYFDKSPVLELKRMYPIWSTVSAYREGRITEAEYLTRYRKQITEEDIAASRSLLQSTLDQLGLDKAIFTCYENFNKFCHRYACAEMIAGEPCERW